MFYRSVVESVLCFCMLCWYGSSLVADRKKLARIIKSAKRLGCDVNTLDVLHDVLIRKKVDKIMKDIEHPLNVYFNYLPSGKRISSIYSKNKRIKKTFVPSAIRAVNNSFP